MLPCLWLCFHERLPALLLDQKTGDGKGTQGTGRTRKRREGGTEQGFLQVAPGSRTPVRAVGGKRVVRLLLIPVLAAALGSARRGAGNGSLFPTALSASSRPFMDLYFVLGLHCPSY